jgi:hypothetical protein
MGRGERELDAFNRWLGEQPAAYRVIVPGNHDTPVWADPNKWRRRLSNATLLLNEGVTIERLRIWARCYFVGRRSLWNARPRGTSATLLDHS